jgi:hypothetical protein
MPLLRVTIYISLSPPTCYSYRSMGIIFNTRGEWGKRGRKGQKWQKGQKEIY